MRNLKKNFVFFLVIWASIVIAPVGDASERHKPRWIETTHEIANYLRSQFGRQIEAEAPGFTDNTVTLLVAYDLVPEISGAIHQLTGRCGGFVDVTDEDPVLMNELKAKMAVAGLKGSNLPPLPSLSGAKQPIVRAVESVQSANIESFVKRFSNFHTRFARHQEGVRAAEWLRAQWVQYAMHFKRDDIKVELIQPAGKENAAYIQPSVRIRIPGSDPNLPRVILGGHLDSVTLTRSSFWPTPIPEARSPGADDNASGIGALTEAYRVLLEKGFRPRATVEIFGYAAEELGLYGSNEIALRYREANTSVRGVLQLDMVGFPVDAPAITFITDDVSPDLTVWTEQLYGLYVGGPIARDRCGYSCSDHASWTKFDYPSVFPFESAFSHSNDYIHSSEDVWDGLLDAEHASRYSKLAVAFATELSETF